MARPIVCVISSILVFKITDFKKLMNFYLQLDMFQHLQNSFDLYLKYDECLNVLLCSHSV
jgi:hypothetical protein